MIPSSKIARLVQALLFELLDDAGVVQGQFGPAELMTGDDGFGILVNYPPRAGWGNDDTAGLKWAYNAAGQRRLVVLDGPAIETTAPAPPADPTDRAGVALSADTAGGVVERLMAHLYAGDAAGMIPATAVNGRSEVKVQRFGNPGAYTSIAELRVPGGAVTLTNTGTSVGVSVPDENDSTPLNSIATNASTTGSFAVIYEPGFEDWDGGYKPLTLWRVGHIVFVAGLVRVTAALAAGAHVIATIPAADLRPDAGATPGVALGGSTSTPTAMRLQALVGGQLQLSTPIALSAGHMIAINQFHPTRINI